MLIGGAVGIAHAPRMIHPAASHALETIRDMSLASLPRFRLTFLTYKMANAVDFDIAIGTLHYA